MRRENEKGKEEIGREGDLERDKASKIERENKIKEIEKLFVSERERQRKREILFACVCVCVRVCVREREKEREREIVRTIVTPLNSEKR